MLGTASATAFYLTSQRAQKRSIWQTLVQVPMLMSIGIGIALNNAIACLEALFGHESPFIRTPKYGDAIAPAQGPKAASKTKLSVIPIPSLKLSITFLEIAFGLLMLWCAQLSLQIENTAVSLPFLILFAAGYLYVGLTSLATHTRGWRNTRKQKRQARLAAA